MRINVYSQELTCEVMIVTKRASDTGVTYHGIRLYLASPDCLHHETDDDDRSAITFWIPDSESMPFEQVRRIALDFAAVAKLLRNSPE